ncbi:DUF3078 domain-containing protein [Lutimonas zeaxanthinifaciens]|uniref:DUF3078 domain-containing protein n=1 Tax=Lutimonas zeaxanthinifaciens TaxID=3060215 RepID=UPI00265CDA51|nr:DUF3078 domain-containing protein [Lutimonas sp. YSD2104]WKK65952.1 DUF3078 domain-containing protein [Lutimonas sp. YSD2104]
MKKVILALFLIVGVSSLQAQTKEELKALKKEKTDSIAALKAKEDAIQAEIDALPGWRLKATGTIGGSISGFNNWYGKSSPNSSVGNFGININAFADLIEEKYFWKNAMNINIGWVKFDDEDDPTDSDAYEVATDVFNISSLYGYKVSKNFAVSALMEYRSTLVDNFNNPGFLDLGVGGTWTPLSELTVVIHPANYNFVFSSGDAVYDSTFGAKVVADYTNSFGGLNVKSNLSIFLSYEGSNFSNYTWTNSFSYTVWKSLGVGFDFGLRKNHQEALNYALIDDPDASFDTVDNDLQSFWLIGLNITLD